ncbi:ribosomal protein S18-alanine N-acetyltransferase [Aromatoleum petrolei]|uniref:[Ribosomal protein bS18]-alanine N-acetyltransferase n=2 Tax=Aromatoleum petrolei TaxID=76116 RepID=A0ABX1MIJ7_9RHOO|nr:ribosomal protein S18-alanine N-acetyltransferase [Aromatoleum petrolei]NMF87588.1 ribosomal protein S18-alanine N-acetyltransferase [Aromatoleum petrolei]
MTDADLPWVVENERELHAFPWSEGNFADSLRAGYNCWVMCNDAGPVAYAVMLTVIDEAHLLNISVTRGAQRNGIGGKLLEHLFSVAQQTGATQFFLEVRPSNTPALALYEGRGFVAVGRRKGYYPALDGGREEAIVMRREL